MQQMDERDLVKPEVRVRQVRKMVTTAEKSRWVQVPERNLVTSWRIRGWATTVETTWKEKRGQDGHRETLRKVTDDPESHDRVE
jgi:hypothetical protein